MFSVTHAGTAPHSCPGVVDMRRFVSPVMVPLHTSVFPVRCLYVALQLLIFAESSLFRKGVLAKIFAAFFFSPLPIDRCRRDSWSY